MENTNVKDVDYKDTLKKLNMLLEKFYLGEEERLGSNSDNLGNPVCNPKGKDNLYELSHCEYCGKMDQDVLIVKGYFGENICADCKNDLLQYWEETFQIVDEVVRNIGYMYGISWNKRIKIKNLSLMENFRIGRSLYNFVKRLMAGWKRKGTCWENGILKDIIKIKSKKKVCILKICTNIPAGVMIAEIVYAVIKDYLRQEVTKRNLKEEEIAGLAKWYMVYYLYNMDYARYGDYYNDIIGKEDHVYSAVKEKKSPNNREIVSLEWEMGQVLESVK